jgi:hypothetical protein
MPKKGGKRAGAGRPVGATTRKTREIAERAAKDGLTPLEYFMTILRNEKAPDAERFAAAKEAAPYIHPKLAAVQHSGDKDSPLQIVIQRFSSGTDQASE